MYNCSNTAISNSLIRRSAVGVRIIQSNQTTLVNMEIEESPKCGIILTHVTMTVISNVSASQNRGFCIMAFINNIIVIVNCQFSNNVYEGAHIYQASGIILNRVSAVNNSGHGIKISTSTDVTFVTVSVSHNDYQTIGRWSI